MNVSAASLAPDSSVRKATPSDITERTARSGAVVETIFCQDHGVRSVQSIVLIYFLADSLDLLDHLVSKSSQQAGLLFLGAS